MWIITKDHMAGVIKDTKFSQAGTLSVRPEYEDSTDYFRSVENMGFPNMRLAWKDLEKEIKRKGTHFKIYDDDGELYFSGYSTEDSLNLMAPLYDWATPQYGATTIKYRSKETGKYETL